MRSDQSFSSRQWYLALFRCWSINEKSTSGQIQCEIIVKGLSSVRLWRGEGFKRSGRRTKMQFASEKNYFQRLGERLNVIYSEMRCTIRHRERLNWKNSSLIKTKMTNELTQLSNKQRRSLPDDRLQTWQRGCLSCAKLPVTSEILRTRGPALVLEMELSLLSWHGNTRIKLNKSGEEGERLAVVSEGKRSKALWEALRFPGALALPR